MGVFPRTRSGTQHSNLSPSCSNRIGPISCDFAQDEVSPPSTSPLVLSEVEGHSLASPADETRRPLLDERRDALAEIGGRGSLGLEVAFEIELLVEGVGEAGVERLLDEGEGARRLAGKVLDQRSRLRHPLVVVDAPPNHTPIRRLLC